MTIDRRNCIGLLSKKCSLKDLFVIITIVSLLYIQKKNSKMILASKTLVTLKWFLPNKQNSLLHII